MNAPVRYAQCAEHYCTIFEGAWQWGGILLCVMQGLCGGVIAPHGGLLGFSGTVLYRCCFAVGARWGGCCSALAALGRLSCAAYGCVSSRVAASGGQGGIGGLRVPPTPSLDSLLTPLYRRRSAEGLEAAERRVLIRRSAAGAKVEACCFEFCCCLTGCVAAFLRRLWLR